MLPFIFTAEKLNTTMSLFWYQSATDTDILTSKINGADVENVILLLPYKYLNDVIESVSINIYC